MARSTRLVTSLGAILATVLGMSVAQATTVVVDFEAPAPTGGVHANYVENGFRFSPNCHYDRGPYSGYGFGDTHWIGFDAFDCERRTNPDFTGPAAYAGGPTAVMFVESLSGLFTLSSFWLTQGGYTLTSSNGGVLSFGTGMFRETVNFSGAEWTDISWLLFEIPVSREIAYGFDHFIAEVGGVAVPEPAPYVLVLLALAAALEMQRRARLTRLPARRAPR